MPASSVEHGARIRSCKKITQYFRHLSSTIALKRKLLTVDVAVSPMRSDEKWVLSLPFVLRFLLAIVRIPMMVTGGSDLS